MLSQHHVYRTHMARRELTVQLSLSILGDLLPGPTEILV